MFDWYGVDSLGGATASQQQILQYVSKQADFISIENNTQW